NDAEICAALTPPPDRLCDGSNVVGNLRKEDYIGATGDPRSQRKPPGPMPHNFCHDDAMMAVSGAVQAVNCVGGNSQRRVKTECGIGHRHVVVDRLWQSDDVKAELCKPESISLRSSTSQTDQRIKIVLFVILEDRLGHVPHATVDFHPVRFIAAG